MKEKGDKVLRVKKRYEASLLALQGVVGVGVGQENSEGGHMPCIKVYVERIDKELRKQIPESLDGFSVFIVETGKAILR